MFYSSSKYLWKRCHFHQGSAVQSKVTENMNFRTQVFVHEETIGVVMMLFCESNTKLCGQNMITYGLVDADAGSSSS